MRTAVEWIAAMAWAFFVVAATGAFIGAAVGAMAGSAVLVFRAIT